MRKCIDGEWGELSESCKTKLTNAIMKGIKVHSVEEIDESIPYFDETPHDGYFIIEISIGNHLIKNLIIHKDDFSLRRYGFYFNS